jgi:dTMP kinase
VIKMKGTLIAVEGIDGSGKSTFCLDLAKQIRQQGTQCVVFQEPTYGSLWGIDIRLFLAGKLELTDREILAYFMLDRVYDVNLRIKPALRKGLVVIMDRYYFSTAAYQGNNILMPSSIATVSEHHLGCPVSDVTIWLQLDVETALDRIKNRLGTNTVFEKTAELIRINNNYEKLFDRMSGVKIVLDASIGPEALAALGYVKTKKYLK